MFANEEQRARYEQRHGLLLEHHLDEFRPYQDWMAERALALPGVYLAADMGLGKTAASLWAAYLWREWLGFRRVLVVAPKPVAAETWPMELAVWDFAREMTFTRIMGDARQRKAAIERDGYIHIINRENLPWLLQRVPKDFYDALIYDEASRFKSGRLLTVKKRRPTELGMLVKRRDQFKRIVLLSGTPMPNGVIDLWGPMKLIDGGLRLGTTRQAFLERWFVYNQWRYTWVPRQGAEEEIMERISDVFFTLKSEDYITLPPLNEIDAWVVLPEKARLTYEKLKREAILEAEEIDAANGAVLASKLLQFANGHVYDVNGNPRLFHDEKLRKLGAIVSEAEGQPLLVFYSYQFDLDVLVRRFPQAEVFGEKPDQVKRWNDGKIPMLLLHPQSAGHGLNLQYGGDKAVWFGLPWSLELYQQANKRLHRPGQKRPVALYRILARDTYDERVLDVLSGKDSRQERLLSELRAEIARVRKAA